MIGPFSLAGRIFGVSEALEATLSSPELLIALLEKATAFLCQYAVAFREAGACGVIMAEPAAGLLSPRGLARFSAPYVKQVVEAAQNKDFTLVLHNCSAKLAHLPRILESGAEIYHFGAPMDLPSALAQVDGKVILCGNLDPTAVFKSGSSDEVREKTKALLESTAAYPNYVISSGCDLAPQTPLENLDTFYQTVNPIYYCS
jgi:uroporphyrinogen decarboxylase